MSDIDEILTGVAEYVRQFVGAYLSVQLDPFDVDDEFPDGAWSKEILDFSQMYPSMAPISDRLLEFFTNHPDTTPVRYQWDVTIAGRESDPFNLTQATATSPGDVCPRCGAEVRERALLTSTFVGCLC